MSETIEIQRPGGPAAPVIDPEKRPKSKAKESKDPGYLVICWNDPVNLMPYVTHVFQQVFGWDRKKAETHMLEVHNHGKSVLAREAFEKAEFYVHRLQKYALQATLEPAK